MCCVNGADQTRDTCCVNGADQKRYTLLMLQDIPKILNANVAVKQIIHTVLLLQGQMRYTGYVNVAGQTRYT